MADETPETGNTDTAPVTDEQIPGLVIEPSETGEAAPAAPDEGTSPAESDKAPTEPKGTDKALKDTQSALTKEREARREAELRAARAEGYQQGISQQQQSVSIAQAQADEEAAEAAFWTKYEEVSVDDPAEAARMIRQRDADRQRSLQKQMEDFQFQVMATVEEKDPRLVEYEKELTESRSDDVYFQALPVESQLKQAKKLRSAKGPSQPAAVKSPGSPASSAAAPGAQDEQEDPQKRWAAHLQASGAASKPPTNKKIDIVVEAS